MGENSNIEWTTHTFNPWRGCTKISAGCTNCYAETLSHRNPGVLGIWGDNGTRVVASESAWREPLKWDRKAKEAGERHRVFCASLADVFEDREELESPRERLRWLMFETPHLDWLILTKRPVFAKQWIHDHLMPTNYWLGVSVENHEAAIERIPVLMEIPASVRFLSMEPLIGPVDLSCFGWRAERPKNRMSWPPGAKVGNFWVIVGGESGGQARFMQHQWARSIRDWCRAAGVPFFMKQMTKKGPIPDDLMIREFPQPHGAVA